MVKAHSPINWQNEPSQNTPINEENLNKMDKAIGVLDDRIIEQETSKLDKSTAYTMVKDISFNENNGIFTVTRLNGSTFTIDTRLEKIAINFKYDYSTQKLIVTLIDGTTQSIDMSALVTQYEFADSATLDFSVGSDGKITATIKNGSITEDMLQPNYLAEIKVETEKSAQSMANAKISENNAKQSELNAKASEEQALEYSNNAQPLAQSVSGNNLTATNSTDGSVIYLKNSGYTQQDGTPSPNTPIHINGLADKGYFDGNLLQGEYSFNDGTFTARDNAITNANLIECKENDNITINYDESVYYISVAFYDENKAFISGENTRSVSSATFTAPANAKYFRFSLNDYMSDLLIANAKHICVTINGMYALRVKTGNKNKLNVSTLNFGKSIASNGTLTANEYFHVSDYIPVSNGKTYYYSNATKSWDSNNYAFYDKDRKFVSKASFSGDVKIVSSVDGYIRIEVHEDMTATAQFEEGTVATPYEPHQESEALIPVSAPLYEGDYIEVYADGSGREYRKMGEYVANVSKWDLEATIGTVKRFRNNSALSGRVKGSSIADARCNAECNQYIVGTPNETWSGSRDNIFAIDNSGFIYIHTSKFSTLDEFKSHITSNQLKFVYELAEPTTTPLTAEQVAEFMKLQTFKGVTHVTADGEVVMRYYCDNASGETVSMLQGMASNGGSGDVTELFKTITVTETTTLPSNQITSISIPIEVPSGYSIFGIKSIHNNTLELLYGFSCGDDSVSVSVKNTSELETQGSVSVSVSCIKTSAIS